MSNLGTDQSKIILAGLPNSGVRTIKAIVVDNNPPKEIKDQIERLEIGGSMKELLHRRVITVRCGGDKSIQDIISRENDPIYQNVEALVFVLDITEQSNFTMAQYFFDALVSHLHRFSPNARVYLLLHKVDLIANHPNYAKFIRATKNLFHNEDMDIFIHETSIFDDSAFLAFKDVLTKEYDNKISIKNYLGQFLPKSSFIGMAVYSHDGLPIYQAGEMPTYVELSANILLSSVGRITDELEKGNEVNTTIIELGKKAFIIFKVLNKNSIFIGLSRDRPKFGKMLLESDEVANVLENAMS
jgi:predicted regulator of Ras-like GTPase activity (Roadblock/LC7/MglB family)